MKKKSLTTKIPQSYPGFHKTVELGVPRIYAFTERSCEEWHQQGIFPLFEALKAKRHFPVFRMSHGELHLALGKRLRPDATLKNRISFCVHRIQEKLNLRPPHREYSAGAGTAEEFSKAELNEARSRYIPALRNIAKEGLLAGCFQTNPGYIEYFPDFFDWLDQHEIPLTPNNYIPFYSVYVMIFGPDSARLFQGNRILVVNYLTAEKRRALSAALTGRGAASVQFIDTPPDRALFHEISLDEIDGLIDLVLVGAGCGAATITEQLRPLRSVVIDAGFALDALARPELRYDRAFCVPDDVFDPAKVKFRTFG